MQAHGQAGLADLLGEGGEDAEARLGREREIVLVAVHRAEQPPHLGERRATRPLHSVEGLGLREVVRELVAHAAA